jgi:hypothetical protein
MTSPYRPQAHAVLQGCRYLVAIGVETDMARTSQHITGSFRQTKFLKGNQLWRRDELVGMRSVLPGISGAS